jgi:hypothetical protein
MKRLLLASLTALSLLLLVVSIFFFIRSYFRAEWIALLITRSPAHLVTVASYPGRFSLSFDREVTPRTSGGYLPPLSARATWTHYSAPNPALNPGLSIHSY